MRNQPREDGFGLLEMTVAGVVLAIVLSIVGNYLISASRTVAQSTAHQDDNAAAQRALSLIESNVRYACNMSILSGTLYVSNSAGACSNPSQPVCAEWYLSGGNLVEKTSSGSAPVVSGVSGLTFTGNTSYNGLLTVQFNLRQPADQSNDPNGVTVNQTLSALNMTQGISSVGSVLSGCP
jgi:type II secretory pathway pseudopilin PulG